MPSVRGRLENKTAVVVGGGQTPGATLGNGRATALLFARAGARVLVVDQNRESAVETAEMITAEGGDALAHGADVTRESDCAEIAKVADERLGRVDILHNNVGIVKDDGWPLDLAEEAWQRIMNTNLTGMWLTCKHVIPLMRRQGSGSVITVSSMAAPMCAPNSLAYAVSKNGVNSLTRALALDNAAYGIRVNCIAPGLMDTPLGVDDAVQRRGVASAEVAAVRAEIAAARAAAVPMGHQGSGWDTAHAALFFASDESAFITGALLPVDGGHTLLVAAVSAETH